MLRIGGLYLPDIAKWTAIPELPSAIVGHKFDMATPILAANLGSAVACHYWRVPGLLKYSRDRVAGFRASQQLGHDQLLVLHGEGPDTHLENFYLPSLDHRLFEVAASLAPVVLVSPGYSVYTDGTQCRWWQPYNLKRSAGFMQAASNAGLPCIPWIASNHVRDTERLIEWINRPQHRFSHIAVNFQTKGKDALNENIQFAQIVDRAAETPIHWVIFGIACEKSIGAISRALTGQFTFISGKVMQRARSGCRLDSDLKVQGVDRDTLIRDNTRDYQALVAGALKRQQLMQGRHISI